MPRAVLSLTSRVIAVFHVQAFAKALTDLLPQEQKPKDA